MPTSEQASAICKRHGPFAALLAVAVALRFVDLGGWPGAAGDEGNWTSWALAMSRGNDVVMPHEASFVSLAFPRLMAMSFTAFGPSMASARAVNAMAGVACVLAMYLHGSRVRCVPERLAAAAVMALHPWSVAWSRSAAVPYSLALACMTVGTTLYAGGLELRKPLRLALGIVVVAAGAHFSPLAVVAAATAAVVTVRPENRWALRHPATYAGLLAGAALVAELARSAASVAASVQPAESTLSATSKLARFAHMVLTGASGEATLRHFGGAALPVGAAVLTALPFLGLFVRALAERGRTPRGLALPALGCALVLLPLMLAPARNWFLPGIDRERYLFVFLPGLAWLVGERFRPGALGRAGALLTLAVLGLATLRLVVDARYGGGPDHGSDVFAGGGAYRGFRTSASHRAPLAEVADVIERSLPVHSGVVLSEAALRPLDFELTRRRPATPDGHPPYFFAEAEYYPDPYTYTGQLAFVLYAPGMFAARPTATAALDRDRALRARIARDYVGVRRIGVVRQPNGADLLEVFIGRRTGPPSP